MKKLIISLIFLCLTFSIFSKKIETELLYDDKYYGFKIDMFFVVIDKNQFYLFQEFQVWQVMTLDETEKTKRKYLNMKNIEAIIIIKVNKEKNLVNIKIIIIDNRRKIIIIKKYNLDYFMDYLLL
jgi:hypothetical protein